jgi:hypothetical protein
VATEGPAGSVVRFVYDDTEAHLYCNKRVPASVRFMLMPNLLEEGLLLFNDGKFYEAHEVWEDLWRVTVDPPLKTCYQGLIQAAVGLHHLTRQNRIGAGSQLAKSMRNLRAGGTLTTGLDIPDLIRQLEGVLSAMPDGPDGSDGPEDKADEPPRPLRIARLK